MVANVQVPKSMQTVSGTTSKRDTAVAMCTLLSHFANPDHDYLRHPPFTGKLHADTGVAYELEIDPAKPHMFGVYFMITINRGSPQEDSKLVKFRFDMNKFDKDAKEYVLGTVKVLMQGIDAFVEYDKDWEAPFVASLEDELVRLEYGPKSR